MSFQAMAWAMALEMAKSTEKFVLVVLANYADEMGRCYPTIDRLVRDTNQDRKTILKNLHSLCDQGLLSDTGHRTGATKSVVVYQIIGLPVEATRHYVYKLTEPETGRYYYGKRSFAGDPETDTYRGSGKWPRECADGGVFLMREIVGEYETVEEALVAERTILRGIGEDKLCMNVERPHVQRQAAFARRGSSPNYGTPTPGKQSQFSVGSSPNFGTQNLLREPIKEDKNPLLSPQGVLQGGVVGAEAPKGEIEKPISLVKKATRLGNDWSLPDSWGNWALEAFPQLTVQDVINIAAEFRDYWVGVPGQKGTKLDWEATFRNSVRMHVARHHRPANGMVPRGGSALEQRMQRLQERVRNEHGIGRQGGDDHQDDVGLPLLLGQGH